MKKNDYIKVKGNLKKILDPDSGSVLDVATQMVTNEELKACHIPINEEILKACGFENVNGEYVYIFHDADSSTSIIINKEMNNYHIMTTNCIKTQNAIKEIVILSKLQDFYREHSNKELNIDEKRLAEIVNKSK